MNKFVFISAPYSSTNFQAIQRHIESADEFAKKVFSFGYIPINPNKMFSYWDTDTEIAGISRQVWLECTCFPFIDICEAVFVCGEWQASKGVKMEIEYAKRKNKAVCFSLLELLETLQENIKA